MIYTQEMSVAVGARWFAIEGVTDRSEVKNSNPDKRPGFGMLGYSQQLLNNKHAGFGYLTLTTGDCRSSYRNDWRKHRSCDGGIAVWEIASLYEIMITSGVLAIR